MSSFVWGERVLDKGDMDVPVILCVVFYFSLVLGGIGWKGEKGKKWGRVVFGPKAGWRRGVFRRGFGGRGWNVGRRERRWRVGMWWNGKRERV